MSVAADLAAYIVSLGGWTLGGSGDWAVYVGEEPATPDNVVTFYDTGGAFANPEGQFQNPTIQIRVRSRDYLAGYTKAAALRDLLILPRDFIFGDWHYSGVVLTTDVAKIGKGPNNCNLFTVNFRLGREPYTTA